LFRPTNQKVAYQAAEARLKFYLRLARIDNGETLHGFRSGCALTLAFSGSALADIMSHVGWKDSATAVYYMKLAHVLRAGAPADLLASLPEGAGKATSVYTDYNHLNNFVLAFPPFGKHPRKRRAPSDSLDTELETSRGFGGLSYSFGLRCECWGYGMGNGGVNAEMFLWRLGVVFIPQA
jgi:hypothetical protein